MRKNVIILLLLGPISFISAQTSFKKSSEQFRNGEYVWNVIYNNQSVGEFWPVNGLNLVTSDTDPEIFESGANIESIQRDLRGVATAPDGMTGGSIGTYQMEGKCLSNGRPCGDGFVYQYGVICVSPNGFKIKFTHSNEINDFNLLYSKYQKIGGTLFFCLAYFVMVNI